MSDYISREALKEALENADADVCESYPDGYCDWGFGRKNINDVIDGVPAADVEPVRHGEWIIIEDEYCGYAKCSVCGDEFTSWEGDCAITRYCPSCGAKMDLEGENHERG